MSAVGSATADTIFDALRCWHPQLGGGGCGELTQCLPVEQLEITQGALPAGNSQAEFGLFTLLGMLLHLPASQLMLSQLPARCTIRLVQAVPLSGATAVATQEVTAAPRRHHV